MYRNISTNINKIFEQLNQVNIHSRRLIKYGFLAFLAILSAGILFSLQIKDIDTNQFWYLDYLSKEVITTSFKVLAIAIIGALVLDYFFAKRKNDSNPR